jgi:molybdopterin/thiamine biosynthesis adenylyltransferase/rhodanese-related sulfurtransferase
MANNVIFKTDFSPEELRRYGRHFVLPEVGSEGQNKLKASRVLVVGAGGLGSAAALYLGAVGIGRMGIVDSDTVDLSNLQRQILYSTTDVGRRKTDIAGKRITELNPHVEVILHSERLTRDNAMRILDEYDVVIDGTDNFVTRYLVNDACVLLKKPYVFGSIFRFEGQATVFNAAGGPCYRCLHAEPPPAGLVPTCAEGGVLGVLPGIIGSIQAAEAIKLILGFGRSLAGRLLLLDAVAMEFRELKISRNKSCPICGDNPTITTLIDYEEFCSMKQEAAQENPGARTDITVQQLKERMDRGEDLLLLDVRQPYEYQLARLNALLIPLDQLGQRLSELDRKKEIVVYCHSGMRSAFASKFLREQGFDKVQNLLGGIDAWSVHIDPSLVRY